MSDDDAFSDRVAAGVVVRIPPDVIDQFPAGTVVTRNPRTGVLQASIPVSKPGEPQRIAHVVAPAGEAWRQLAAEVQRRFPKLVPRSEP